MRCMRFRRIRWILRRRNSIDGERQRARATRPYAGHIHLKGRFLLLFVMHSGWDPETDGSLDN